jgi:hypothetical protein
VNVSANQQKDLLRKMAAAHNSGAADRINDWFTEDFRLHGPEPLRITELAVRRSHLKSSSSFTSGRGVRRRSESAARTGVGA